MRLKPLDSLPELSRALTICLLILVTAFAVVTTPAYSQTLTTGDVTGALTDPTGAVVAGATVTLRSEATGTAVATTTNTAGSYRFTLVTPGSYMVSAQTSGLKSQEVRLIVGLGQVITVNLTAELQSTQQVVEVREAAPVVDTENANLARSFDTAQMMELPAPGGDITTVAFTVPGIAINTGSGYGNFSSHGLPGTANLFTINGNDYNDPYLNLNNSGASNLLLGQNEVAEVSVVQNGYSVQYGRNAGANVNYVTKSGTNQFHGDLMETWNGTALNANDFFNNVNGLPRPHAISNNYAANFGGPALKNKLFFFTDTEGLRYILPTSADVAIPSPQLQQYALATAPGSATALYKAGFNEFSGVMSKAQPVTNGLGPLQDNTDNKGYLGCGSAFAGTNTPAPGGGIFGQTVPCAYSFATNASNQNIEWLLTDRADWNITDSEKIFFRFKTDHGFQPTGTNVINPTFNVQSVQPQDEGQISLTSAISPSMVNSVIASVLWYSAIFTSPDFSKVTSILPVNFNIANAGINGAPGGFYPIGFGYQAFGVIDEDFNTFPQGRNAGQFELVDDFSWQKGEHNLKLGVNYRYNRVSDYSTQIGQYGTYTFNSLTDFVQGMTNAGTGSNYTQSFAPVTDVHIRLYNIGFYAQDEWNIGRTVKLTYGLRVEHTGNPQCLDDCFSRMNVPFNTSGYQGGPNVPYNSTVQTGLGNAYPSVESALILPRLGAVWSPRGANSMVIRAGVGLFADLPPGGIAQDAFTNFPYLFTGTIFGQAVGAPAAGTALAEYNAFRSGFSGGATLAGLQNAIPGFSAPNFFSFPSNLNSPKYLEWSFEIEQPFGQKNVLLATYSGNHGYNELMLDPWVNSYYNAAHFPNGFGGLPVNEPDPRFNGVMQLLNSGVSNYDGLSVAYRRAFGYGFQGEVSYTWSHALDELSSYPGEPFNFANSVVTIENPIVSRNYSNADTDIRNNFLADFTWDTPWKLSNRALGYILGNWTLSSKFYARSGAPFSVFDGSLSGLVTSAIGTAPFVPPANILASPLPGINTHCGTSAINTPCFTAANFVPSGQENGFGAARNTFYGPGYFDIDTALYKNFPIGERMKFSIGAQAFNMLNHPNFANPSGNIAGSLGTITSTVSAPTSPYGSFQGSAVSGRVLVLSGRFSF